MSVVFPESMWAEMPMLRTLLSSWSSAATCSGKALNHLAAQSSLYKPTLPVIFSLGDLDYACIHVSNALHLAAAPEGFPHGWHHQSEDKHLPRRSLLARACARGPTVT